MFDNDKLCRQGWPAFKCSQDWDSDNDGSRTVSDNEFYNTRVLVDSREQSARVLDSRVKQVVSFVNLYAIFSY